MQVQGSEAQIWGKSGQVAEIRNETHRLLK